MLEVQQPFCDQEAAREVSATGWRGGRRTREGTWGGKDIAGFPLGEKTEATAQMRLPRASGLGPALLPGNDENTRFQPIHKPGNKLKTKPPKHNPNCSLRRSVRNHF